MRALEIYRNRKTLCVAGSWHGHSSCFIDVWGNKQDENIATRAASSFRALRKLGVTVRKAIDSIIATHCIESGYELLHDDRDFDPFEQHLGLRAVA